MVISIASQKGGVGKKPAQHFLFGSHAGRIGVPGFKAQIE
jgi:hypothetical protein